MQKERSQRKDPVLSAFSVLDVLGAFGAVVVFLGVSAKVFLGWIMGG